MSRWARLRTAARTRLWPLGLCYAAVTIPLVLRASAGRYVGDNRFELYWNPARRVARTFALWDGSRGLGRIREDLWPGPTLPTAALRAIGLPPWLAESLFHAGLLVALGLGVVALIRIFRPTIDAGHVVAGAFAIVSPYSMGFLLPSQLFLYVAMAPWLAVVVHRGVHSRDPWRWAAAFALLTFLFGNTDPPGAIYALIPTALLLVYVVAVERTATMRDVVGWLARAAALAMLVNLAALVKLGLAAATFAQRLNDTETPETAALTSSWAESWRGLGFWLIYFRDAAGVARPQALWYFSSSIVVTITFLPPIAAVAALWTSRWRPRLLFAAMAVVALVIMVGGFPLDDPPPVGAAILDAYQRVPGLAAFRNSYKAGAGLVIGIGALLGAGVVGAGAWLRRFGRAGPAVVNVFAALLLAALAQPLVVGDIYDPATTMGEVPAHWVEALEWLETEDPSAGRVLVLPGTTRADYRWGWPGDDIFDALLARDHAVDTSIPLSNPRAAELLHAISEMVGPDYVDGSLAPVLSRLGIDTVVVRNDLTWERSSLPRPDDLDGLRADDDLTLVATFGEPGRWTTDPADRSVAAGRELQLPPVEVYRVRAPGPPLSVPDAPPLLVAGNGDAWPALSASGMLDDHRPVIYTADLDATSRRSLVDRGGRLVLTDTNRRRMEIVVGFVAEQSHTLAVGQDLDRPSSDLFAVAGSQSVATHRDARQISASGKARTITGFEPWYRPAQAFDGQSDTAWQVRIAEEPVGRSIRVDLAEPVSVDSIELTGTAVGRPGPHVARVALTFSDGSREVVDLEGGQVSQTFRARTTSSVDIEILGLIGSGSGTGSVGFSEIEIPGIDLAEDIAVPDDLRRAAQEDPALRDVLESTSLTVLLQREAGDGPAPIEASMRRRFWVPGDRSMALTGSLRLDPAVPDEIIADLAGVEPRAVGNRRHLGAIDGAGILAVDGDESTAWRAPAESAPGLTIEAGDAATLDIVAPAGEAYSPITELVAERGDQTARVTLVRSPACSSTDAEEQLSCATVGRVDVPAGTGPVVLRVTGLERRPGAGLLARPVAISEVFIDGAPNDAIDRSAPLPACDLSVLSVDGAPVPVRFDGTVGALLAGEPITFSACEELELTDGWHRLDSSVTGTAVDVARLDDGGDQAVDGEAPSVRVARRGPAFLDLAVDAPDGGMITTGESWDPGWVAFLDGEPLGPAVAINTLSGWRIPAVQDGVLHVVYLPQQRFDRSMALTVVGLLLCAWLVVRPRRWDEPTIAGAPPAATVRLGQTAQAAVLVVAIGFGAAVAGTSGAVVAGAAVVAGLLSPAGKSKPAALGALLFLLGATAATVLGSPLGEEAVRIDFAARRMLAAEIGAVAGVLVLAAVLLGALGERAVEVRRPERVASPRLALRLRSARQVVVDHLPVLVSGGVALIVRAMLAPSALAPSAAPVFTGVDLGLAYRTDVAWGASSPLAIVVAALSPLGPDVTLVLASAAVAAVAAVVAGVAANRRTAWLVGLAVAVLPLGWAMRLPEALAALAALLAVRAARGGSPQRAIVAGTLAAAGVLCRLDALVVVVGLGVWGASYFGRRWARTAVVAAAVPLALWWRWLVLDQSVLPALAPADAVPLGALLLGLQVLLLAAAVGAMVRRGSIGWQERLLIGASVLLVGIGIPDLGGRGVGVFLGPLALVWLGAVLDRIGIRAQG